MGATPRLVHRVAREDFRPREEIRQGSLLEDDMDTTPTDLAT
jgi:hypothetical protein